VLTRPLSLKLLAPTVLVSLLLVGTCIAGALYLNRLHVDLSRELSENVTSTIAASNLEMTVRDLVKWLGGDHPDPQAREQEVRAYEQRVRSLLAKSRDLANWPREEELVEQASRQFDTHLGHWQQQTRSSANAAADADARLAADLAREVLPTCRELQSFNIGQVGASDRENLAIVNRLTALLLAVGFGAPVAGLLLGYAVARSLYHSMYQLSVRIRDAAGRLNRELRLVTLEAPLDLPDLHRQMQGVLVEIERVVEQLQQRDREVLRAEQMAAVGQVAAGVAHELRNPLTSIKMLVQTGLEGPEPGGLPPEDLVIVESEVRRMEACIRTFLDFARPPLSERRRGDLVAVVRRALALVEGRARRQKVVLRTELPPGPVELLLDGEQIHQVLVNLLLNALDALPHGGTVRLEVRAPDSGHPWATVCVHDSGLGIAPRIRERLFEPFVSSKETGLGLGLSICRRLLEAHGGTIQGENAPGGGAEFAFTLPA
jgi:signal transduction histidine kinase